MRFFGIISICFFLLSCDPTYVIAIQNNSKEIIKLRAKVNQRFHSNNFDSIYITYLDNDWIEAFIKPNQQLDCGYAIAGLENDIPFNELKIFISNDSIVAKNQKEVLKLLDNRGVFKVMTPYVLEIY